MIEILIVLALVGIMAAMSAPLISFGIDPLRDTTNRIAANFRLVRSKAMSQTSAYLISQTSATQLKVERAATCFDTTWAVDHSFTTEDLSLIEAQDVRGLAKNAVVQIVEARVNSGVVTPVTNWTLCYDSRGVTSKDIILTLKDVKTNKQKKIQVFSGGGVQIYEN